MYIKRLREQEHNPLGDPPSFIPWGLWFPLPPRRPDTHLWPAVQPTSATQTQRSSMKRDGESQRLGDVRIQLSWPVKRKWKKKSQSLLAQSLKTPVVAEEKISQPHERGRAQKWQLELERMAVREDSWGRALAFGKVGKSRREKGNTN